LHLCKKQSRYQKCDFNASLSHHIPLYRQSINAYILWTYKQHNFSTEHTIRLKRREDKRIPTQATRAIYAYTRYPSKLSR